MAIKVRLFLNGELVDPKELTITNITVSRTVNDVIDRMEAKGKGKKKKPNQVA